MQPLKTHQRVLTWLYMCSSNNPNEKRSHAIRYITINLLIVTILTFGMISSMVHCSRNLSVDFEMSLFSLFQISANASALYAIFIAIMSREKMLGIFKNLTKIYNASKRPFSQFNLTRILDTKNYTQIFHKLINCGSFNFHPLSSNPDLIFRYNRFRFVEISNRCE